VVAYDFGIKHNILRRLASYGCRITVVPATYPAADVLKMNPDGVFFSNGPVSGGLCAVVVVVQHTQLSSARSRRNQQQHAGRDTGVGSTQPLEHLLLFRTSMLTVLDLAACIGWPTGLQPLHLPMPVASALSHTQGDPSAAPYAVENAKTILGKKPVFGICMGHQVS
jgi:hypothetical protein